MKKLLGGQIGLEDFIFAHKKGKVALVFALNPYMYVEGISV